MVSELLLFLLQLLLTLMFNYLLIVDGEPVAVVPAAVHDRSSRTISPKKPCGFNADSQNLFLMQTRSDI